MHICQERGSLAHTNFSKSRRRYACGSSAPVEDLIELLDALEISFETIPLASTIS